MRSLRNWALALGMTVVGLGFGNQAQASFTGDTLTVSLTVHTTGAVDQNVFSGDTITANGTLYGDSQPYGASAPLEWSLTFSGNYFTLTVSDVNNIGPTTVDPLVLDISGSPISSVVITSLNDFGFVPGDITLVGPTEISISAASLAALSSGGSLSTSFAVPEASTFVMMSLVASGVAGGYFFRRRRNG